MEEARQTAEVVPGLVGTGGRRHLSGRRRWSLWLVLWHLLVPPAGHKIIPTTAGYALIFVSLGIGTAAYMNSSNILFIALSLLLSALLLSGFLSMLNFKGVSWELLLPAHFRAGEPASVRLELYNEKKVLPTYNLWFNVGSRVMGKQGRLPLTGRLEPRGSCAMDWMIRPAKRGRDQLEVSGVESMFPFGFLRKTIGSVTTREVIVWPRRVDYTFTPPAGQSPRFQGESRKRPGSGSELMNLRQYQPGDPQKLVHWKASARLRQLVVRQIAEENRESYLLWLDTATELWADSDSFERFCEFAGSLAEDLFTHDRLLGYAVNDEPVVMTKRLHDLHVLLERISTLEPVDHPPQSTMAAGLSIVSFHPAEKGGVVAYVGTTPAGSA